MVFQFSASQYLQFLYFCLSFNLVQYSPVHVLFFTGVFLASPSVAGFSAVGIVFFSFFFCQMYFDVLFRLLSVYRSLFLPSVWLVGFYRYLTL